MRRDRSGGGLRKGRRISPAILAALAVATIPLSAPATPASASGGRPGRTLRIIASVMPLRDFAAAIAGERGEAEMLMPPGADVHSWQPRPGDLVTLTRADLFVYVGAGLEPWAGDVLRGLRPSSVRTLEVSRGLQLLSESEEAHAAEAGGGHAAGGAMDPHIWMDFGLDQAIAGEIAAALTAIDPAGAATYAKNRDALRARLGELDDRYRHGLAACRGKTVIVAGHAAFGYLCRRYGLTQVTLSGTSPDAAPSPRRVIEAVDIMRRQGLTAVFHEPTASPDLARTLAREVKGRVLTLQTGVSLSREEAATGRFFAIMDENLRTLRDGLDCR